MTDFESIELFNTILKNNDIKWTDQDLETLEDDDDGNRLKFYVYYQEPKIPKNTDLQLLKNLYNTNNTTFKITELVIINDELRVSFENKMIQEEKYLYY